jgi:hypothetical protein
LRNETINEEWSLKKKPVHSGEFPACSIQDAHESVSDFGDSGMFCPFRLNSLSAPSEYFVPRQTTPPRHSAKNPDLSNAKAIIGAPIGEKKAGISGILAHLLTATDTAIWVIAVVAPSILSHGTSVWNSAT